MGFTNFFRTSLSGKSGANIVRYFYSSGAEILTSQTHTVSERSYADACSLLSFR